MKKSKYKPMFLGAFAGSAWLGLRDTSLLASRKTEEDQE